LTGVVSIALGGYHTCALTGGSSIYCWGSNSHGQLGAEVAVGENSGTPEAVTGILQASGGASVTSIALGMVHSCVLFQSGFVWCWGDNSRGQLGIGFSGNMFSTPQLVSGLSSMVTFLSVGAHHGCATTLSEHVWCFGYNDHGQVVLTMRRFLCILMLMQVSRHVSNTTVTGPAVHVADVEFAKRCSVGMAS
jgi:alpha-tubulin suppressor-like RCC1 family protein